MEDSKHYMQKIRTEIDLANDRLKAAEVLFKQIETVEFDWIFSHVGVENGQPVFHSYPDTVKIERCSFGGVELHLASKGLHHEVLKAYCVIPAKQEILIDLARTLGADRLIHFELYLQQDSKSQDSYFHHVTADCWIEEFHDSSLYSDFCGWEELFRFIDRLEEDVPASTAVKKKKTSKI